MTIRAKCPICSQTIEAPDRAAGKIGKCPRCGETMRLPSAGPPPFQLHPSDPVAPAPPVDLPTIIERKFSERRAEPRKSSLVKCGDCGAEVSPRSKACPKCGRPTPGASDWIRIVAACVVLAPILLIGGCFVMVIAAAKNSPPRTPSWTADLSPTKQSERGLLITKLIQQGVFYKVEKPATLPHVWITPTFRSLDYDTKQLFVSAVFLYHQPVELVVLKDSLTGQRVGSYSPDLGLSIDD